MTIETNVKPRQEFGGRKRLSPQSRLSRLVRSKVRQIENTLRDNEDRPTPYFWSRTVLSELSRELKKSHHNQTKGYKRYTLFGQLIANEIAAINRCVEGCCKNQADKLYEDLKSKGTSFELTRSKRTYELAA